MIVLDIIVSFLGNLIKLIITNEKPRKFKFISIFSTIGIVLSVIVFTAIIGNLLSTNEYKLMLSWHENTFIVLGFFTGGFLIGLLLEFIFNKKGFKELNLVGIFISRLIDYFLILLIISIISSIFWLLSYFGVDFVKYN